MIDSRGVVIENDYTHSQNGDMSNIQSFLSCLKWYFADVDQETAEASFFYYLKPFRTDLLLFQKAIYS